MHLKSNGILRSVVGIVRVGGIVRLAAAGNKREHHHEGKKQCSELFHGLFSSFNVLLFVVVIVILSDVFCNFRIRQTNSNVNN